MALKLSPDTRPLGQYRSGMSHFADPEAPVSRRVAVVGLEGEDVSLPGAATGANLGGSSKHSRENVTL